MRFNSCAVIFFRFLLFFCCFFSSPSVGVRFCSLSSFSRPSPDLFFRSRFEQWAWLIQMSIKLRRWFPRYADRVCFLRVLYYESMYYRIDPELILAIIHVESDFKKYAVSSQGALGYMQIMPFWIDRIGQPSDNLFDMETSIHYGCQILRYYIEQENGDVLRALQRYNGNTRRLGYPYKVWKLWKNFWTLQKK